MRKRNGKFRVEWREGGRGSATRSRTFDRQKDAEAFELEIKRRKQLGPLAASVLTSRTTLTEFVESDYWPHHAIPNLAADTRRRYLEILRVHLLPRMGDKQLQAITPRMVRAMLSDMGHANVGAPTQRKTLMLLQGILRLAESDGVILRNPVQSVQKPKQPPTARPQPLAPEMVERIRREMLGAWTSEGRGAGRSPAELQWWRQRNSVMLSLFAYAGVRPSEDRAARWGDVRGRSLRVLSSKTDQERDVKLLAPLAQDLAAWRLFCGRPSDRR